MAYDTPKAAHFTATDDDGNLIPEHITQNLRWLVASKVEHEFPDLLGIKLSDIPRIQEICEKYSSKPIKITFQVPAYLTDVCWKGLKLFPNNPHQKPMRD